MVRYLENRTARIKVQVKTRKNMVLEQSVHQGRVMSPIVFLAHTNVITENGIPS